MKKIDKRRILISIILILMIIIQIKAFTDSRANKITSITAKIIDTSGLLSDEICTLQAVNEEESGTVITLPSVVNEKKIKKYIVETKQINQTETDEKQEEGATINTDTNIATEENINTIIEEKVQETTDSKAENKNETSESNVDLSTSEPKEENTEKNQETLEEITNNTQEKLPGEKLYLTQEELENAEIKLYAVYESKEKNEQTLYNKVLELETEEHKITMVGYMPAEAKINVEKVKIEEVTPKLEAYIKEETVVRVAYDITILVQENKFEPNQFDENVEVTISGLKTVEEEKYKVVHIDDENNTEEVKGVEIQEDTVKFKAKEFSTYAILSEPATASEISVDNITTTASEFNPQNIWNGTTISTSFSWGEGTESKPYLIADASELAYLAKQVNSGTNYEGKYFQLASDIDLGNNVWTPIGTTDNSFRGILDGAGHTIANAKITISSLPDETYDSYGLFGSIGGGTSRSTIRNLELTSIEVDITASGSTATSSWWETTQNEEGIRIGCLTGTLFKNASIENVIVSNSTISDTNTIQIYNYQFQFAVGGVVGYITNTSSSDSDPGSGSRYVINNCYSNVQITLDATANTSSNSGGPGGGGRTKQFCKW